MTEKEAIKICVAGACGRMGRRLIELAFEEHLAIGGAFDVPSNAGTEIPYGETNIIKVAENAAAAVLRSDVLLDFTVADAVVANVHEAAEAGIPAVVGTSGLNADQRKALDRFGDRIALVIAPNTSVGVNLLFKLTAEVASILGLSYNVEITEIHHNKKVDSPSGTAVRLAERAAEALGLDYDKDVVHGRHGFVGQRPANQIGVHALRGGDVVGEHTVSFVGQGERIELTHRAHSRDTFARGALRAARFAAAAAPGVYDMQDVLGLR